MAGTVRSLSNAAPFTVAWCALNMHMCWLVACIRVINQTCNNTFIRIVQPPHCPSRPAHLPTARPDQPTSHPLRPSPWPGCRHEAAFLHHHAAEAGLRVLAINRPGVGASTADPGDPRGAPPVGRGWLAGNTGPLTT